MKSTKPNTKKYEHNTKQMKYRRKQFNFTALVWRRVDTQVEGGEEGSYQNAWYSCFILLIDLLIRMLLYMCELQSLRHAGQETSSKNCARASC
jgi:hypothetical protein